MFVAFFCMVALAGAFFSKHYKQNYKSLATYNFSVKISIVWKIIFIFNSLQLKITSSVFTIIASLKNILNFLWLSTVLKYRAVSLVKLLFSSIRNKQHLFLFHNLRCGDNLVHSSPLSCRSLLWTIKLNTSTYTI